MPELDFAVVRDAALAVLGGLAVLAVVVAIAVRAVMSKVLTLVVLGALAFAVWTQRSSVQECADDFALSLRDRPDGVAIDAICTFFGVDVTMPTLSS